MTDSPLDIAILIDDAELVRLVSVWPKLSTSQRKDLSIISKACNVLQHRIDAVLTRAQVNNLIHEDGSINSYAEKYISTLVAERIKKATK